MDTRFEIWFVIMGSKQIQVIITTNFELRTPNSKSAMLSCAPYYIYTMTYLPRNDWHGYSLRIHYTFSGIYETMSQSGLSVWDLNTHKQTCHVIMVAGSMLCMIWRIVNFSWKRLIIYARMCDSKVIRSFIRKW